DGEVCTDDACVPSAGGCVATPVERLCDDGDVCTLDDFCRGGLCVGAPDDCDDDNDCTADTCAAELGGCGHEALSGPSCVTGDLCSVATFCVDGACVGPPLDCFDNNPCTDDRCDPAVGCEFPPRLGR